MNGQSSLLQTCYGKASCCSPLHNMLSISLRNFLDGSFKTNGQYRVRYPLSASDLQISGDVHYTILERQLLALMLVFVYMRKLFQSICHAMTE